MKNVHKKIKKNKEHDNNSHFLNKLKATQQNVLSSCTIGGGMHLQVYGIRQYSEGRKEGKEEEKRGGGRRSATYLVVCITDGKALFFFINSVFQVVY